MIKIIKELNIEVSKPNIFQAVVAKQYDMNTRFIKATLVDGADVIEIPTGTNIKVVINAERPDGQSKGFDGEVNTDNTVTVPLHSWMLELEGTVVCDISVIDTEANDNKKLTTTTFTLMVEKAAFGGTDITSDPQFDVLASLMDAATVAQEALDKSNQALELVAACEEATENANAVREEIEAGGYIKNLEETNTGGMFSFWVGTEEQYNALTEKVENRFYIITDDPDNEDFETLKTDVNNIKNQQAKNNAVIYDASVSETEILDDISKYSLVTVYLKSLINNADVDVPCVCKVVQISNTEWQLIGGCNFYDHDIVLQSDKYAQYFVNFTIANYDGTFSMNATGGCKCLYKNYAGAQENNFTPDLTKIVGIM